MPLNYEFRHKDHPSESPGVWLDSKLVFKATGDKHQIKFIAHAIKKAIAECEYPMVGISFKGHMATQKDIDDAGIQTG